jgi:hypothetical protein
MKTMSVLVIQPTFVIFSTYYICIIKTKSNMKNLICISVLFAALVSCKKSSDVSPTSSTTTPVTTTTSTNASGMTTVVPIADQTLLLQGTFTTGAHTTSGTVKVYEDKNKNRSLVFENFKTDAGPDLRIYLAEDKVATNPVQITDKVTLSGNYSLAIPATADLKKQVNVLIWCKSFSVLFGSATLK